MFSVPVASPSSARYSLFKFCATLTIFALRLPCQSNSNIVPKKQFSSHCLRSGAHKTLRICALELYPLLGPAICRVFLRS